MELLGTPLHPGRVQGRAALDPGAGPISGATGPPPILCCSRLDEAGPAGRASPWAGIVTDQRDLPSGAVLGLPAVGALPPELFRDGEVLALDGSVGRVELDGVEPVRVVTSFLEREDGRILLARRSERVGSFRGRWAGISGYLEDPTPFDQAVREVREETGIEASALELRSSGRLVYARDGGRIFVVAPFRFRTKVEAVRLDWEHTEFAWVEPSQIRRLDTVPRLDRAWEAVAPKAPASRRPNP
jgi:8-oxo-dGTP diphosphatase